MARRSDLSRETAPIPVEATCVSVGVSLVPLYYCCEIAMFPCLLPSVSEMYLFHARLCMRPALKSCLRARGTTRGNFQRPAGKGRAPKFRLGITRNHVRYVPDSNLCRRPGGISIRVGIEGPRAQVGGVSGQRSALALHTDRIQVNVSINSRMNVLNVHVWLSTRHDYSMP